MRCMICEGVMVRLGDNRTVCPHPCFSTVLWLALFHLRNTNHCDMWEVCVCVCEAKWCDM